MLLWAVVGLAQMPGGRAVQISHKTQVVNGRRFLIHVVEQGQTVYAISRAYGLKEVEAVTKKDIHFLQVGDTVWLPCKGQRLADGTSAPKADGTMEAPEKQVPAQTKSSAQSGSQPQTPAAAVSKPLGPAASIRPRVNSQSVVVSLMMPLNLSQMDKISTTKFDVEQRGKTTYKSLEFIQFYEGLVLGLEQLEAMGCNVTLNVVDVEDQSDAGVEKAFRSHNVAQSDLLIAMLTRQPFQKAAELAREARLFVVNPVSDRPEIVEGNPYVFKCMPSREACVKAIAAAVRKHHVGAHVIVVHSNAKSEKSALQDLSAELTRANIQYTLFDWAASSKFAALVKSNPGAVVVSLCDQEKSKKRIYVQQLLNKLSAFKTNSPVLYTFDDWSLAYSDIDFAQLQNLDYHTFYADWNMDNAAERAFVDTFKERFKTEPTSTYAGMANDIIIYFVAGLQKQGTDFFKSPAMSAPRGVMSGMSFSHDRADNGFENQSATLYRMVDYHFTPVQ